MLITSHFAGPVSWYRHWYGGRSWIELQLEPLLGNLRSVSPPCKARPRLVCRQRHGERPESKPESILKNSQEVVSKSYNTVPAKFATHSETNV